MDVARSCVGLGPVAVYLLLLGWINLARRPMITTGTRDMAVLGVALCGLMMVGPVELLMPPMMVADLGPLSWLLVLGLYFSSLSLWVLLLPPRLVIYNLTFDELKPALEQAGRQLDNEAHWAGNTFILPGRSIQFIVQPFATLRNISLVATGEMQSYRGWRDLDIVLRGALANVTVSRNPRGLTMVAMSLLILTAIAVRWINNPQAVTQGLIDMFGL